MTQTEPKQLSFDFAIQPAFVEDNYKEDIYCDYDVRPAPKSGYGLHILTTPTRLQPKDKIVIHATPRQIIKAGGNISHVYKCRAAEIPVGDFFWWNYVPNHGDVSFIHSSSQIFPYLDMLRILKIKSDTEVTCILYSDNQI